MLVKEYLKDLTPKQYHIFDSHQEGMVERGVNHADQDYLVYEYNIHKNNKPQVGDVFLYRRPGRSSKNRKFNIYGGGVIKNISAPDRYGNVALDIKLPFALEKPLEQGNLRLETFQWTSKAKAPNSWSHFWNQYGMNVIDEHDFYGLVGDLECTIPENRNFFPATSYEFGEEENTKIKADEIEPKGFKVSITEKDNEGNSTGTSSREVKGTHIDYDDVNHTKLILGKAGELLVMEILREQYEGTRARVEHTSAFEGDGYGYDITVFEEDGSQTLIEVKTTKSSYVDGFYITPKELNVSRQCELNSFPLKRYKIYRVYNFNPKEKTADIKIYDGPFKEDSFRFVTVAWKVYKR